MRRAPGETRGHRPLAALAPMEVTALAGVRVAAVACGEAHCIALDGEGRLWSWGKGAAGQLGTGSMVDAKSPVMIDVPVPRPSSSGGGDGASAGPGTSAASVGSAAAAEAGQVRFVSVACGVAHSAAVDAVGAVFVWGAGGGHALGLCDR